MSDQGRRDPERPHGEALNLKINDFLRKQAKQGVSQRVASGEDAVRDEIQFYKRSQEEQRIRKQRVKNDRRRQDMDLREKHAEKAVGLAQMAVSAWVFLYTLTGAMNLALGLPFLSENALMYLTGGATVNVIAVYVVVVKGLFPPAESRRRKKRKCRCDDGNEGDGASQVRTPQTPTGEG